MLRAALETNHERTLYVPYVFCNHLISSERDQVSSRGPYPGVQRGSRRMSQTEPALAAGANGGRIRSARAAARFPNSELSCWVTGIAINAPSARSSRRARR